MKPFEFLLEALVVLVFTVFATVLLIEWLAGCGETYVDARGVRHQNECVFITNRKG